ncbi:P-loop ATPase, Sll1717 family [Microbacterium laevaniformans]|uniref:P-loop ATPase, Sll1717 family n=1 Tax=Microbacterium laevaniformans TaxID=36807 RepID=UPI00362F8107
MTPTSRSPEIQPRLESVDLGGADAESDVRLEDHFVTTPYVSAALNGRRRIFLGRKGAGKSALWRSLPRLAKEQLEVVLLSPDDYSTEALQGFTNGAFLAEKERAQAWKLWLVSEAAARFVSIKWDPRAMAQVDELRRVLNKLYQADARSAVVALAQRVRQVNFSVFGLGIGVTQEPEHRRRLLRDATSELLEGLKPLLAIRGAVVGIDRLDDAWDGSDESKTTLIGLLRAAKELNDTVRGNYSDSGLRILVFLRSEIYESLTFEDKDKHHTYEQTVAWNDRLLTEMVLLRVPDFSSVDELFERGRMDAQSSAFQYILRRTFMRPRELLQFLDECFRVALSQGAEHKILRRHVREAEKTYSHWKVGDLIQEYRHVYPELQAVLQALRGGLPEYSSADEVARFLEAADGLQLTPDLIDVYIDRLFEISVLGIRDLRDGARYRAEQPNLVMDRDARLVIHPSLHRELELRRPQ